jgi:hypothetical protein
MRISEIDCELGKGGEERADGRRQIVLELYQRG